MRKRLNHKIKYSEKDYVKKNYMKDGKAVIPIKIKKGEFYHSPTLILKLAN